MTTTITPTTSHRIEGVATLLSSLSHGGEHAGTVGFLRREKIAQPEGGVVDVPIVSGNALRGLLRDHAADVFWRALGQPELPVAVFHLLWSGGSLSKAGTSKSLNAQQLSRVRDLIPLVSLFGGSGAGRIIEGKLSVGKLVPICTETAHILPEGLTPSESVWSMLQIEEFTRRDDAKRDLLQPAIAPGNQPAAIEAPATLDLGITTEPAAKDVEDGPAQQMRYGVETLAAGTRLHWWMSLRHVTDCERDLFVAAVNSWSTDGAHIGGRSATGHGRLRLDVHQWQHATPTVTVGQSLAVTGSPLAAHCDKWRDEIIDTLGLFA